jgi:aerobic-type carbon monoxide dehydrogenase small subunit (CoxS/CutS family)
MRALYCQAVWIRDPPEEASAMSEPIQFTINGQSETVTVEPDRPLLEVIREELGLTGTKYGCGEGACRSCTVLIDGRPRTTCEMPVSDAAGKTLTTIEGLAHSESELHPLQQAFISESAMQCGYCVPGMILTAAALLEVNANPSDDEINEFMNGNICRCTNYPYIVNAIKKAAANTAGAES